MNVAHLLADLVALPSPSGQEQRIATFVATLLEHAGFEVEVVGKSVVARRGRGGTRLLLTSHLDTVPVGAGWTADPYDATWRDDRLFGRGSNDAKASVAAMIAAASAADVSEGTVILGLNACEETTNAGMADVLDFLEREWELPDCAVVGEPTGLEVVRAQAGLAVIEATWGGVACHAAHVASVLHANALTAAARELATLPDWIELEGTHGLLGTSTLTPTVLAAGERHNLVPDRAVCTFDARLAPPHDAAACVALLEERLPGARIHVRSDRLVPVETEAEHPFVQAALAAAGRTEPVGSMTMSDMALLSGFPAVKCGPGDTARSHTADEYVTHGELLAGEAFYAALIPAAFASPSPTIPAIPAIPATPAPPAPPTTTVPA